MQSDSHSNRFNNEKEIDWKSFFLIILDHKKFITLITTVVTLAVIILSFTFPNQYTASVLLKLSDEQSQSTSSSIGGAAGLASMAGITLGGGNNSAYYTDAVLRSKKFLSHIASFPGVRENLTVANGFDFKTGKILYKKKYFDGEKKKWLQTDANGSPMIPSDQDVIAVPYDTSIIGYGVNNINTLRLWKAESVLPFDFKFVTLA